VGRSSGLLLLCASVALGQGFSGLATNRDGSVLYFSSAARAKGTSQYLHPKIFRWDSTNGVSLFEQRPNDFPLAALRPSSGLGSIYFSLTAPDVSADGAVRSFIGLCNCWNTSSCQNYDLTNQTTVYTTSNPVGKPVTLPGLGALSPNGRYVAVSDPFFIHVPLTVLDLQTSQSARYVGDGFGLRSAARRWIADDGTIILTTVDGIALANGGQLKAIPGSGTANFAMVNDSATLVLFERPGVLSAYSVKDGTTRDLVTGTTPTATVQLQFGASMSSDGTVVAFLYGADRQVYVIRSDGTGLRQVTQLPNAVREVTISGDGTVAFAVTAVNSVVRIDIATASSSEIIPATPYTSASYNEFGRGFIATLPGSGFAAQSVQAAPPYPLTLNGVELRRSGAPIPLASVTPNSITYAVPWDVPDSMYDVEIWVSASNSSPFVPGFEAAPPAPTFALLSAIHGNFSALVTQADPAQPGESVHLYGYNLGPVTPAPPPGTAAPLQPISALTDPLACFISDYSSRIPIDVLFAGLAPTLLNVFQVDVRLPTSFASNSGYIQCHIGDPAAGYFMYGFGPTVWLGPPAPGMH
jgi:uncharacterized protein (TIGR03437 family)